MSCEVYRFVLTETAPIAEALSTLHLSIIAAEGLFGQSRVRMEVTYFADAPRATILVDGSTLAGNAVVRIFTSFITREFGPDSFAVRRVTAARQQHDPRVVSRVRDSMGAAA